MLADGLPGFPNLVPVTLLGLVVLAVVLLARRADFTIRVRRGRVWWRGKFPRGLRPDLEEFLLRDLALRGSVTICGRRQRGRLETWFRGGLTPGQKQRIRNFLLTRL
ncbi:MAG TPA: hypothetical protein VJ739_02625 [Gemmataceae bacterium]|nr:hypothetical protein [Gemmataceae bacterium]